MVLLAVSSVLPEIKVDMVVYREYEYESREEGKRSVFAYPSFDIQGNHSSVRLLYIIENPLVATHKPFEFAVCSSF